MAASCDVEIVEVDPADEAAFGRWFAVARACEQRDRPGEPGWLPVEQREASRSDPDCAKELLAAVEGGAVVGAARLELPLTDNRHLCEHVLLVHPDARRRGIGRALDEQIVRRARAHGRDTLLTFADEPPHAGSGNRAAGLALGYALAQIEVRRDLDLPLDPQRVAELERTCAAYGASYDVQLWWDRWPDELAEDGARLHQAMSTDVPLDAMDWRPEVWDVARLRRHEQQVADSDRSYVGAGAVHRASGRVVAFTTMGLPRAAPERAYQWETLVQREHRGHRLGLRLKLAALQELHARSPRTSFISTWNARENAPMIAVNDALGARVNGGIASLQKRV